MGEKESQSIEWKESWQDEYLKWICGYSNASGGTIKSTSINSGTNLGWNANTKAFCV